MKKLTLLKNNIEYWKNQESSLTLERERFFITKNEQQESDQESLNEMKVEISKMQEEIEEQKKALMELKTKRRELAMEYQYGKHLAEFGDDSEGLTMNASDLALVHQTICEKNFNSQENIEKLKKFFSESNIRTNTKIFFETLQEGMDRESYWDFIIEALTSRLD